MPKHYDIFISYSQQADDVIARGLERGLKQMGRRWNERRALTVFRDASSLSAAPDLWDSLANQLDNSRYAVALLSPEAAHSKWVNREIEHYLSGHSIDRLLLVLTSGHLEWDPTTSGWTPDSSSVPPSLSSLHDNEPLWVDVRWARDTEDLDMRDPRWRGAIATLAAPVHGLSRDELESEDLRAHRQFVRVRRAAVASLAVLLLAATTASLLAMTFRDQSNTERALRQEVEVVATELNDTNDALMVSNTELDQANDELETANLSLDARNDELDQANADLESTNAELDRANAALESTNAELDQANADLESTNVELDEANDNLTATNTQLDEANKELEESNADLEDANAQLDLANAALQIAEARAARVAGAAVCIEDDLAVVGAELSELANTVAVVERERDKFHLAMWEARGLLSDGAPIAQTSSVLDTAESYAASAFDTLATRVEEEVGGNVLEVSICTSRSGYPFKDRWAEVIELASTRTELYLP